MCRVVKCCGHSEEDDDGEVWSLGEVEHHQHAADGEDDCHPPCGGEAPADVAKLRTVDPSAKEFTVAPERGEDQQTPKENRKITGVHLENSREKHDIERLLIYEDDPAAAKFEREGNATHEVGPFVRPAGA